MAINNNPDVLITQLGEEKAKAGLRQARGQNSISWTAGSTFGRSDNNNLGWNKAFGVRIIDYGLTNEMMERFFNNEALL